MCPRARELGLSALERLGQKSCFCSGWTLRSSANEVAGPAAPGTRRNGCVSEMKLGNENEFLDSERGHSGSMACEGGRFWEESYKIRLLANEHVSDSRSESFARRVVR